MHAEVFIHDMESALEKFYQKKEKKLEGTNEHWP